MSLLRPWVCMLCSRRFEFEELTRWGNCPRCGGPVRIESDS